MATLGYVEGDVSGWGGALNVEAPYGMLEVTFPEAGTVTAIAVKVAQNQDTAVDVDVVLYNASGNPVSNTEGTCQEHGSSTYTWLEYTGLTGNVPSAGTYYITCTAQGAGGKLNILQNTTGTTDAGEQGTVTNAEPCVDGGFDASITIPSMTHFSLAMNLTYTPTGGGPTGVVGPLINSAMTDSLINKGLIT